MDAVEIQGSFVTEDGYKVEGVVAFIPDRLWVMHKEQAYATYHQCVTLDEGSFKTELTPTDTGYSRWRYTAITPAGVFKISVPKAGPHYLKDLIATGMKVK